MLVMRVAGIYIATLLILLVHLTLPVHAQSTLPTPEAQYMDVSLSAERDAVQLNILRLDFWEVLPGGSRPSHDLYVAVLGEMRSQDGTSCIRRNDFAMVVGDGIYTVDGPLSAMADFYGLDFPVRFWGVCTNDDEAKPFFVLFDLPHSNGAVQLLFQEQLQTLPDTLATLYEKSAAPQPTATPTNTATATHTPTYTPTFTPAVVQDTSAGQSMDEWSLPAPADARIMPQFGTVRNAGLEFRLERIDFWSKLPDGSTPQQGAFVVLMGALHASENGGSSHCIGADDVALRIGEAEYPMADKLRAANRFYDSDFPGFILDQCVSDGRSQSTFFIFDVPTAEGAMALSFHGALLNFDASVNELRAISLAPTPTPTPPPTFTNTPRPTATATDTPTPQPSPTHTPILIPTATATSVANTIASAAELGTPATVERIIDGDTIDVRVDGQSARVRYILMDTPEVGEPFYEEATAANRHMVEGQTVYLEKDISETDRYGRLLRYVYLPDGTFVNAELVRQGYAQVATFPPDISHEAEIRQAQAEAMAAGAGLWGNGVAVAEGDPTVTALAGPNANRNANLRAGPSTDYPVIGGVQSGQPLDIVARTEAGDWYQLANSAWLASFLVDNAPEVAVAANIPPPPAPTAAEVPTATPAPPADTAVPPQPAQESTAPQVIIERIDFDGQVPRVESDEYAVIANVGSAPINIGGWRLNAGNEGQDFIFPSVELVPGQRVQVYTNEYHPESGGFSFGNGSAIWNNQGDCGTLYDSSDAAVDTYCY